MMKQHKDPKHALVLIIAAIVTALFLAPLSGIAAGKGDMPLNSLAKAKEILASNETPEGVALLATRKEITIYHEEPKELSLPVVAINRTNSPSLKLKEITVSDASGTVRAQLAPDADLAGVRDIAPTKDAVLAALVEDDTELNRKLFMRSYVRPDIKVSLDGLSLKYGDSIRLFTTAAFEIGKKNFTTTAEFLVTIAALPSRTNWFGGDGHVHSDWSDAYFVTIDNRVRYAANNGFGWIAITDHENLMTSNGGWSKYIGACNGAQSKYGIPVLPGGEVSSVLIQGNPSSATQGHVLGYWLSLTKTSIPKNSWYTPQNLINEVNNHNPGYSYPVIAHPYGYLSWRNWNVTGFRAMELLSNERQAKTETINKWFELLRAGLSSKIAGGSFIVGTGNTDAHNFMAPGDGGFTWLYSETYSPTNRGGIWAAIKAGRVSASGRKDLGIFTISNANQGSV
ncbi:MAG TPA: hypothetical protein VE439_03755, partial [Anaerolineae bacterium]|nr:hypothetical protein [Anaerolineae bacterium]